MTGLLIYAAFAALILLLPIAGVFPLVEWHGVKVRNEIFSIEMRPRLHPKYGTEGERFRPVFAQELVEWYAAWLGALLIIAPVAVVLSLALPDPIGGALATPLSMLAWKWRTTRWGKRQIEYIGHAAEMIVAERQRLNGYTRHEVAGRLKDGYSHLFADMPIPDVWEALGKRLGIARALLTLLARPISRVA